MADEIFQLAKKGPGQNPGGLFGGNRKRTSIRGNTAKKRSTYACRARARLMTQVCSFARERERERERERVFAE